MGCGRTIAFYAVMSGFTVLACMSVVAAYLVYSGGALPRIPVRLTGDWLMERDDEIGFVPVRNASTEIHHLGNDLRWHIFTDDRRARVNAPGIRAADHVDIMTIGCSFTWGANIESEDTYTQQLGRALNVSVANFGMGSYGSVQSFQTLVRHLDLKPKVVVYGFIQDHLRRNLSPCAPNYVPYCLPVSYLERQSDWIVLRPPHMEYFSPEDNKAFNTEVAFRDPAGPIAWFLGAKWVAKIALFKYRNPQTVTVDDSPETATAAMGAMIRAMTTEAQGIGAKLIVLNIPYLPRGRVQPVPSALATGMEGKDVTLVDFSPVAADYYDRHASGTLILDGDPHPNALANRMIAETLAPVVRALLASHAPSPAP